ncbi:MAG TPA: HipA family kinase [Longimicrobiaceae bacterium]|nr:HipA family kinase [Longimicrobiaceae bacterium]
MDLPTRTALRYVQPLREGGSLPAVVDTDDGRFVVKFRGAGQGAKALIAELIVALLARELGLPAPDLALVDVPSAFGRSEPDPEIQDLLRASHGVNVGLRYLDGAFNFALAAAGHLITSDFAAKLVWLDALVTNPDRTHRNTNLLIWERRPWLIDHGAALYAHHDWARLDDARTRAPFPMIRDHVLLTVASEIDAVDEECAARLDIGVLREILTLVPDELLMDPVAGRDFQSGDAARDAYVSYLQTRLEGSRAFSAAAEEARKMRLAEPPVPHAARR